MKTLLDLLPAIAFFAAYYFGGIYAATIAIIAALAITVIGFKLLDGRWHKAHLIGLAVSAVLGGITLFLHDPAFIKLKPSIVYGIFAIALLGSHFVGDKVLLQRLPQKMVVMPDAVWKRVNLAWALFFVFCAVLNYVVAHQFDEAMWVKLKVFGFSLLMIVFMLAHLPFISRYMVQPEEAAKP
ncbi:MAG: septation protein IspZ [Pseudomonadota bacterium]